MSWQEDLLGGKRKMAWRSMNLVRGSESHSHFHSRHPSSRARWMAVAHGASRVLNLPHDELGYCNPQQWTRLPLPCLLNLTPRSWLVSIHLIGLDVENMDIFAYSEWHFPHLEELLSKLLYIQRALPGRILTTCIVESVIDNGTSYCYLDISVQGEQLTTTMDNRRVDLCQGNFCCKSHLE
jgi:hypothetical protein